MFALACPCPGGAAAPKSLPLICCKRTQILLLCCEKAFRSDCQITCRGSNLKSMPDQRVVKVLSPLKSLNKLCGAWILFWCIENAEIYSWLRKVVSIPHLPGFPTQQPATNKTWTMYYLLLHATTCNKQNMDSVWTAFNVLSHQMKHKWKTLLSHL